jgi:hypothetical protein
MRLLDFDLQLFQSPPVGVTCAGVEDRAKV